MTIGGSTVQDSQTGQIVTIGNTTIASGTDITITSGNPNTTDSMLGSISGGGVSGQFAANSHSGGKSHEHDTDSFLSTNTSFNANGNSNVGNSVVVGSSGGTSLDYSAGNYNSVTAQYQSSGTFSPNGTSGTFNVLQSGNGTQGQTERGGL